MKKTLLILLASISLHYSSLMADGNTPPTPSAETVATDSLQSSPLPEEVKSLIDESDEYCSRSFLSMEQNTLEKFRALLGEKEYPETLAARDKVSATLSLWHELDGYKRLLYVPFQYGKVKSARERIYQMQDEMSPSQYEEVYEKLDSPLSHYYHGVKFFQEVLITQFNSSVDAARKERNISEVRRAFTELLKQPEVKENIQNRIMTVPWLAKKFSDYQQYIMNRNSSPRGPIAQEIMKISLSPDNP